MIIFVISIFVEVSYIFAIMTESCTAYYISFILNVKNLLYNNTQNEIVSVHYYMSSHKNFLIEFCFKINDKH